MNMHVWLVTIAGNILALTGDTTLTWSSPMITKLQSNDTNVNPLGQPITDDEISWIGSMQYIGAMVGIFPFGYLADKIGRKPTLLILAVPHLASFLIFAFAHDINLFYFGRFLGGVSLSSVYIVLPMYIAEICEDSYRGMLLVSYSTFASFGDLLPYILGPYISVKLFNVILATLPLIFLVVFGFKAPESPYYYVKNDDSYKAEKSLKTLGLNNKIAIHSIENEIESNRTKNVFNTLKTKNVIKGFIIALSLSSLQQLSGISAVLSYTEIIFRSGGSNFSAEESAIIVGVVLFLASFCGPLLVDRKGRKFLLICSASGMVVSQAILGVYFYLKDKKYTLDSVSWLPIICLVVFTITFNIGFGPLPFTITSEILPSNVKFFLATITGFSGWLVSFLVTKFFNDLNNYLGQGETFWLFCGFNALALLFVVKFVPETKGLSFQEIQRILSK
ncbi:unnamed protein product [Brassicogethes aeneus]|uniref:Major facilitator superfamily (MFS) profile domain-containing protein n=1 Tax=Brassicogethes aeneus TaxID=1431903 RepID=A0A9P0B7N1_BRAAE|nr:unnamed protein product [Brassicogethes aeneus]